MFSQVLQVIKDMFTWIVIVTPWQQGIRVRRGKHVKLLYAGMYLRIPFMDLYYRQSIRKRMRTIPSMTMTNAQGNTVTVGGYVQYCIIDILKLYDTLHDAEDTISAEVATLISTLVTDPLNESGMNPVAIAVYVNKNIQDSFAKYGLGQVQFYVSSYAVVRTLRIITGEIREWSRGDELNTDRHDHDRTDRY